MDLRNWTTGRRAHLVAGLAALAVVAALGGVAYAVTRHGGTAAAGAPASLQPTPVRTTNPGRTATPMRTAAAAPTALPESRFESSLGMQIQVPDAWKVNDQGCNQTSAPSVNRGIGIQTACYTPTPPRKEWATIRPSADEKPATAFDNDVSHLKHQASAIDGVPIERAAGPVTNGMFAGWVNVPARGVQLVARTRALSTLNAILDSAQLVDVDNHGCATTAPTGRPNGNPTSATFVPSHPSAIAVCYYAEDPHGHNLLQSSAVQFGDAGTALAGALNAALSGNARSRPR